MDVVTRFPSPDIEVVGALELEPEGRAARIRRLPAWTRRQVPSENFAFVLRMTSGVRLVFDTDADELELVADIIGINPYSAVPVPAVVELLVDGVPRERLVVPPALMTLVEPVHYSVERRAEPLSLRFTGLGTATKSIELWLPHTAACDLVALRSSAAVRRTVETRRRWVHHGSSISQGGEAEAPTETWPVIAAARAGVTVQNLGFSGNAVGDPFVARTIRDLPADVLSVEIGINVVNADLMRRRFFEPVLHGFIDTVRDGHPDAPLMLIGPIPCPAVESLPGPTVWDETTRTTGTAGDPRQLAEGALSLTGIRESIASVLAARSDDAHLHYLDGRVLLPPEETDDLEDGLHPNARAYRRMGERFAAVALGPGGALGAASELR
ncbi:SGNH/GDSL hydrolase family protein [soil metagenome]